MVTLETGIASAAQKAGVPVRQTRVWTMFTTFFSETEPRDWSTVKLADKVRFGKFFQKMLENGVYLAPSQFEAICMTQLGAKEGAIGMLNTVGALIELPTMLWADRLVGRYGSGKIFSTSLLLQTAATAVVVAVPSIASIFILRAASGFYFSFYTVVSIAFTTEGAPAQQRAAVLTLYYTTLRGIVGLIASPLSGLAFDWLGAYPLYVIAMVGVFLAWLVLIISRQKQPYLTQPEEV